MTDYDMKDAIFEKFVITPDNILLFQIKGVICDEKGAPLNGDKLNSVRIKFSKGGTDLFKQFAKEMAESNK